MWGYRKVRWEGGGNEEGETAAVTADNEGEEGDVGAEAKLKMKSKIRLRVSMTISAEILIWRK